MAASEAGTLTREQVDRVVGQAEAIASTAVRSINDTDFVFFAAFDGTKNNYLDPASILPGEQSTNVAQLYRQVREVGLTHSNQTAEYYAGPGSDGSLPGSAAIPAQVTREAISVGARAYRDFQDAALNWLEQNPGFNLDNIKIAATSFSRGVDAAAVFSHLLYEKGLVDNDGKVLIPPGQLGFSAAVIFDPVATGMQGNVAFSPATQNTVVVQAQNEYRYPFKAVDYSQQEQTTTVSVMGNHADVGGSYDNGIAALTLMNSTTFFQKSGLSISDVPEDRRFDANAPVIVHNEAIDTFGNKVWDSYGQYGIYDGPRLTTAMATPATVEESSDGKTITFTDFANRKVTYEEEYGPGSTTTSLSVQNQEDWRIKTISSSDHWQTTKVEFDTGSPPLEVSFGDEGGTQDGTPPTNETFDQSGQTVGGSASTLAPDSSNPDNGQDNAQSGTDDGSYYPPLPSDEYTNEDADLSDEVPGLRETQSQRLLRSIDGDDDPSHFISTTSLKEDGSLEVRTEYLDSDGQLERVKVHTKDSDGTSRGDYWDLNADGQWEIIATSRQDANGDTHSVYSGYDPQSPALQLQLEAGPGDRVTVREHGDRVNAEFADGSSASYYYRYGTEGEAYVASGNGSWVGTSFGSEQTLFRSESGGMQIVSNDPSQDRVITLDPAGKMVTRYNMSSPVGEGETNERYVDEEYVDEDGARWNETTFFDQQGTPQRIEAYAENWNPGIYQKLVDRNADHQWDEVQKDTWGEDGNKSHTESTYDPQTHALQHEYSETVQGNVTTISEDLDGNGFPDYTATSNPDADWPTYYGQFSRTDFNEDGSVAREVQTEWHSGQPEYQYFDNNGDGRWDKKIVSHMDDGFVTEEFDYKADGSLARHTHEEARGPYEQLFVDEDGNGAWDETTETVPLGPKPYYGDLDLTVVKHFDETGRLLDVREGISDWAGEIGYRTDQDGDGRWNETSDRFPSWALPTGQDDEQDAGTTGDQSDSSGSGPDANAEIDRQVSALIDAMAGFAPTPAGESSPLPEPQAPMETILAVDGR